MAYAFQAKVPVNITLATYATVCAAAAVEHAIWLRVWNRGGDNSIIIGKDAAGAGTLDSGKYFFSADETRVIGPFIVTTGGKVEAKCAVAGDFMVTPEPITGP